MAGIFAKLDVGSRTEAVRAATRAGAIRDPELGSATRNLRGFP